MKILFISPNRLGDAVLTTGILSWLVEQNPDAAFTIACGPYAADLFRAVPRCERLIVLNKKRFNAHWLDLWRQCANTRWDLIVDMRNSVVSRLLPATRRAIHRGSNGEHKVIENGAVLGLDPPPAPHIWIGPEAEREADKLVPKNVKILAIGPAANWPPKQWPLAHFIALVEALTSPSGALPEAHVMILADEPERAAIEPVLRAVPRARRIEVIGCGLQTAAACLKRASLYVGNDSGLMHLAAALGTPTLGLFGPGYPHVYGPWGPRTAYVATPETSKELLSRVAELPPHATLMQSLSVEKVLASIKALIKRIEGL